MHHQYSSSVSPFQAKTGTPLGSSGVPSGPTATAAAAWSWVEKMLQLAQRTSAPSATSVSISTAVCTVMWSDPVIRAPLSGLESANSSRVAISPGISCSARRISLRPNSACPRSATLKSRPVCSGALVAVLIWSFPVWLRAGKATGDLRRGGYRGCSVDDPLVVNPELSIPLAEIEFRASRSSGPGGQHANVTASRIEAVFDVEASPTLERRPAAAVAREARHPGDRGGPGRPEPGPQPRARRWSASSRSSPPG